MSRADTAPLAPVPLRFAPQRLALVRVIAWALLLGGWLVLGALGRQQLPQVAAGQLPVALWLAVIGALLATATRHSWSAPVLRVMLLARGAAAALALILWGGTPAGLLVASVAWAALLVSASFTVRRLRLLQSRLPPAPVACAVFGALLAWGLAGDLDAVRQNAAPVGMALGAAALLLSALVPSFSVATPIRSCRAGLFDCSLPLLLPSRWRHPSDWPQAAAALGMLPMMASLPVMTEWCGDLRWSSAAGTALHLGAMLLPALLLPALQRHTGWPARCLVLLAGGLLALGGVALLWPTGSGLMAASLLHGLAWSIAWAVMLEPREAAAHPLASPDPDRPPVNSSGSDADPGASRQPSTHRGAAMLRPALLTAVAVLLLGQSIDDSGPLALASVHAVLAALGLIGLLAGLIATRRVRPAGRHPRPRGLIQATTHLNPEAPR